MPSIQSKITKWVLKFQFASWSAGTVDEQRARQEKSAGLARLPSGTTCKPVDVNGVPAEWIEAPHSSRGVILYLHGGAYALGSVNIHRELIARLAHVTQCRALAINYRLAPENPFPAALEDALSAYRWLTTQFSSSQIIIAGDSAGGGLTLAALLSLRDQHQQLPAGAICISPWADLELTGGSMQEKAKADPILNRKRLAMYAGYYAGSHARTSPLLSPLYADLKGLPPLLIQVGTDEILLDDSRRIAEHARKAGVQTTLEVYDGMFHVFQMMSFLPETTRAGNGIAAFALNLIDQK